MKGSGGQCSVLPPWWLITCICRLVYNRTSVLALLQRESGRFVSRSVRIELPELLIRELLSR
jgi:hypothetical protein